MKTERPTARRALGIVIGIVIILLGLALPAERPGRHQHPGLRLLP